MSLSTLENTIVAYLRVELNKPWLTKSHLLEWSTSEAVVRANAKPEEDVHFIKALSVWTATPKVKPVKNKKP